MSRITMSLAILALVVGLGLVNSYAMPLAPDVLEQIRALPLDQQKALLSKPDWVDPVRPLPAGLRVSHASAIVLLVDFSDNEADPTHPPEAYQNLLFVRGGVTPGSMIDYYDAVSYGQFALEGMVHLAWLRMPQTYEYYVAGQRGFGPYPNNARKMVEDAVTAADPLIDFSQFDGDGDGSVDALFVVHAGPGYEETGNPAMIHSHMSMDLNWDTQDGVQIDLYSVEPEERRNGNLIDVGVFCHEFGHVLGLPDLYDYDYDADGVGRWCLMSGGSWGGDGHNPDRPVQMLAWCKVQLGWITPQVVVQQTLGLRVPDVETNSTAYRFISSGQQYFLIENRQKTGWDADLPQQGLLITHIDERMVNNDRQCCGSCPEHYQVAIEQADGLCELEEGRGTNAGDPYPGATGNTAFTTESNPNSWNYEGLPTWIALTSIHEEGSEIVLDVGVDPIAPYLAYKQLAVDDVVGGDGDGSPEAGESIALAITLGNYGLAIANVSANLSADSQWVSVTDAAAFYGSFAEMEEKDSGSDTFGLEIMEGVTRGLRITLQLELTGDDGYETLIEIPLILSPLPLATSPSWNSEDTGFLSSLSLCDVNHDGLPDMVSGGVYSEIAVHYGTTDGFETLPGFSTSDATNDYPANILIADLANDGFPEIIAVNVNLDITTFEFLPAFTKLYANTNGTPSPTKTWRAPQRHAAVGAAVGDLTGDGILDLYLGCQDEPDVIYAGQADGALSASAIWTAAASYRMMAVVLYDLDSDNDLDVVVGGFNTLMVYLNQGGALPTTPNWTATGTYNITSLALGDIDRDGFQDLAVGQRNHNILLLKGLGTTFQEPPVWQSEEIATSFRLFVEDLDKDGYPEVLSANVEITSSMPQGKPNCAYANTLGQLSAYAAWVSDRVGASFAATLGDTDLDGDPDLVVGDLAWPLGVYQNTMEFSGCRLVMPAAYFEPNDPCFLHALWLNPGPALEVMGGFVVLDVYGEYFFAPSWCYYSPQTPNLDCYYFETLPGGVTITEVIPEFAWPEGVGSADNLYFYGALLSGATGALWGDLAVWQFSYGY